MTEAELKLEIAIILYKREKISAGIASEWLRLNLVELGNEDFPLITMFVCTPSLLHGR